ncbi:NEDD8 activating enzyme [Schizosaccharomyces japonicus yFS275]|uniref:NEDD8-activating enzyme E1 catalytic subunit n=1 Tax=Schizosaccharomyces japonicus (strain yFS275 / FY16936) TaxID=402676 RepID=B6JWV3_SCHJY|nr:NEDD8 activating enzyme [Schizosaccharomyces japonicus yFS275]EEB05854.1 NEDD8 activating enzyme [Schizosaccharomyces japonicus yFS275]
MALSHLRKLLNNPGPFADAYDPEEATKAIQTTKILVVGAGGLGCEILVNLACLGFESIDVVDMDTIDLTNLNRQFLFRKKDVGQPKAQIAAEAIQRRMPNCRVTPIVSKVQDIPMDQLYTYGLVICGLDSVEARRWVNATLVSMVDDDDPQSLKALIDGGCEGFRGQARVILPTITSCYECSLDMLPSKKTYPICTIANKPRLLEHCVEWAYVLQWQAEQGEKDPSSEQIPFNPELPEHMDWLVRTASERAKEFNIPGVITHSSAQGIVKNIIPSVASTNAIIAAACCTEAFKLVTGCNPILDNYMMYTGDQGVYTYSFSLEKQKDCPVCGIEAVLLPVCGNEPLSAVVNRLKEKYRLSNPSLSLTPNSSSTPTRPLYYAAPPSLEASTRSNLSISMRELCQQCRSLTVTDTQLPVSMKVVLRWE